MTMEWKPGEIIGKRYRLDAAIGRGGYGKVYRAQDLELDRAVAVKILQMSDFTESKERAAEIRGRFRQEARAAARVRHPNIVTIYDVGTDSGDEDLFIVMELLEGRSLAEEIAGAGRIPLSRAKHLFVGCLRGLGAAHAQNIVHKDLKPTNLIIDKPGTSLETLQIIDFGVARLLDQPSQQTASGKIAGTPRYTAPEYIMGEEVTPALDVYQMGLILSEALSGFPAIPPGLDARVAVQRHLAGLLDVAEEVVDSPVGAVLARALAPSPKERFANADAFADALDTVDVSEWEYDDASLPQFTARTYTPSGSFTPSGSYTPVGSFTPSEELAIGYGVTADDALPETVLDQPRPTPTPKPDEPPRQASRSSTTHLAAMALVAATGLGAFYIYRTTGSAPASNPPAPKAAGLQDPNTNPVYYPQPPDRRCVWEVPSCEIDCIVDAVSGFSDCPASIEAVFDDGKAWAAIEVPDKSYAVSIESEACDPTGWVLHVADSRTCNGGGGDAGTVQYNAELQVVHTDLTIFDADPGVPSQVMTSRSFPGIIASEGCSQLRMLLADRMVAVDGMCSPVDSDNLLRLDPPQDKEGAPDRKWFLALNTTYLAAKRVGTGARKARICIGPRYDGFPKLSRHN